MQEVLEVVIRFTRLLLTVLFQLSLHPRRGEITDHLKDSWDKSIILVRYKDSTSNVRLILVPSLLVILSQSIQGRKAVVWLFFLSSDCENKSDSWTESPLLVFLEK